MTCWLRKARPVSGCVGRLRKVMNPCTCVTLRNSKDLMRLCTYLLTVCTKSCTIHT